MLSHSIEPNNKIIQEGMMVLFHHPYGDRHWNLHTGRGITTPLATSNINLAYTPMQLLEKKGKWFKVNVPSLNLEWVYLRDTIGIMEFKRI